MPSPVVMREALWKGTSLPLCKAYHWRNVDCGGRVGSVEGDCHSEAAHTHGVGLEEVGSACETPPGR